MDNAISGKPLEGMPWDVIILGSGPAALTAAIYTTRGSASTLIVGGESWGGQLMLTTTVENFPGFPEGIEGPDLMTKMKEQAVKFGGEFLGKTAETIDVTKTPFEVTAGGVKYIGRSIIVATGASTLWLDAPGVKEFIGRGVASCAPCDAPFFREKIVCVVGGGDAAMEEAAVLSKYAREVHVIHRRDEFRATQAMQEKVLNNPKIKIMWNTEVKEVKGSTKVEKVILFNNKDNTTSEFATDGLFIAIGHKPETDIFKGIIDLDEKGYIKIVEGTKTSVNGVYVAGDVHDFTYKQAITAAGYGCMAAMDILRYLEE
jgi:thioredoxin reductase (NADPH)